MCRPGPSSLRRSGIVISRIQTRARKLFFFFLEIALARAVRLCDNRLNEMTFARGSAHGSAVFFSNGKEANDGKGPARGTRGPADGARGGGAAPHLGAQALAAAQGGHLSPARAHQHAVRALARGGR